MAERSRERTALGAGNLAHPVHRSGCLRKAFDNTVAAEEDLVT
jgi:hypothetical protein